MELLIFLILVLFVQFLAEIIALGFGFLFFYLGKITKFKYLIRGGFDSVAFGSASLFGATSKWLETNCPKCKKDCESCAFWTCGGCGNEDNN